MHLLILNTNHIKKVIYLLLFFVTFFCIAQNENTVHDFRFYKNGQFKNTKQVKLYLVKNSDTLNCDISKDKITIPKVSSIFDVVIHYKKKIYKITDVNFSNLKKDSNIAFGFEKNLDNFLTISKEFPTAYILKETGLLLEINNLEHAENVYFIVFYYSKTTKKNKEIMKSYSRTQTN